MYSTEMNSERIAVALTNIPVFKANLNFPQYVNTLSIVSHERLLIEKISLNRHLFLHQSTLDEFVNEKKNNIEQNKRRTAV